MVESSPKWVENTVGKGEIARYEQFLLFPQCFQKIYTAHTEKPGLVSEMVKFIHIYHLTERQVTKTKKNFKRRPTTVIHTAQFTHDHYFTSKMHLDQSSSAFSLKHIINGNKNFCGDICELS